MKLLYVPADLPLFPITEQFLKLIQDNEYIFWNYARLTEESGNLYDSATWKSGIKAQFPEIIQWFQNLPISSIRNVKFNKQNKVVLPHVDFTHPEKNFPLWKNNYENEPCGYRVIIKGASENKLYVINSLKEKIYCVLPKDTNTYILRQTDGWHGVDNDNDRMSLYIHIEVNREENNSIIARSLDKYKTYAIYDRLKR